MTESEKDTGILMALLQRMEQQRMPRILALKEKVDQGDLLTDYDITFLKKVFTDANRIKPLMDRHPEYHDLVGHVVSLYHHITSKALENEKVS